MLVADVMMPNMDGFEMVRRIRNKDVLLQLWGDDSYFNTRSLHVFISNALAQGRKLSEVVAEAKAKGYSEPDPRIDLSGIDVARKILILLLLQL